MQECILVGTSEVILEKILQHRQWALFTDSVFSNWHYQNHLLQNCQKCSNNDNCYQKKKYLRLLLRQKWERTFFPYQPPPIREKSDYEYLCTVFERHRASRRHHGSHCHPTIDILDWAIAMVRQTARKMLRSNSWDGAKIKLKSKSRLWIDTRTNFFSKHCSWKLCSLSAK